MEEFISGGICGAITDPDSIEAVNHAELYYEEIRHRMDDIAKIAKNTGYTFEQVLRVKSFLFIELHLLGNDVRRFDPSFPIAQTWQRLSDDPEHIQPHDKLLIPHEIMEMDLVNKGISQHDAHIQTSKIYNYPKQATEFYHQLQTEKHARIGKGNVISDGSKEKISGGINQEELYDDWEMCL